MSIYANVLSQTGMQHLELNSIERLTAEAKAFLKAQPSCDCGKPDCLICLAQSLCNSDSSNNIKRGNKTMTETTKNEKIALKFVNGARYLREWNSNKKHQEEFQGDFEDFCYCSMAIEKGWAKTIGGSRNG